MTSYLSWKEFDDGCNMDRQNCMRTILLQSVNNGLIELECGRITPSLTNLPKVERGMPLAAAIERRVVRRLSGMEVSTDTTSLLLLVLPEFLKWVATQGTTAPAA